MKREEAQQLTDRALADLQHALEAGSSESLKQYLDCMGRFSNYSWHNCLLIVSQMPEASIVAGFRRWLELGRHVRKGEKGIGILAPLAYRVRQDDETTDSESDTLIRGFKVVHVFDVSQTDGEDLPQLAGIHGDPGTLLPRLEDLIRQNGIMLSDEVLPVGTKGASLKGKIYIAEGLAAAERFAVLAHELAHEWMHGDEHRQEGTKIIRETEAEAVAYVVCRAFGLDCSTRSSDYIQLHRGNANTLADSLQRIQQAATGIITLLRD
jgi:antirestriction protein ArdC